MAPECCIHLGNTYLTSYFKGIATKGVGQMHYECYQEQCTRFGATKMYSTGQESEIVGTYSST